MSDSFVIVLATMSLPSHSCLYPVHEGELQSLKVSVIWWCDSLPCPPSVGHCIVLLTAVCFIMVLLHGMLLLLGAHGEGIIVCVRHMLLLLGTEC